MENYKYETDDNILRITSAGGKTVEVEFPYWIGSVIEYSGILVVRYETPADKFDNRNVYGVLPDGTIKWRIFKARYPSANSQFTCDIERKGELVKVKNWSDISFLLNPMTGEVVEIDPKDKIEYQIKGDVYDFAMVDYDYRIDNTDLYITSAEGKTMQVQFPYRISDVVAFPEVLIVRYETPMGVIDNRNVFAVSPDGTIKWRVFECAHAFEDSPYTCIKRKEDLLYLGNWDGWDSYANPVTGEKIREEFTK